MKDNSAARARVNERTDNFKKKLDISKAGGWAPYQDAGPTLLAAQPSEKPKGAKQAVDPEWDKFRSNHLEPRLVMQRQWRESWWTLNYSNLSEFILPRRSIFLTQSTGGQPTPNNMTRGRQLNNYIVDPTGTFAVRICAGGLMSGLASPSRPWFKIVPSLKGHQIDAEGRQWLDTQEERLYTVMAGSNFYNAFAQECEDLVVFGTGPNIIYEDKTDLIRCYTPAVGEYYLSSGSTMRVETLSRMFVMTVSQIVEFFNLENCPQEIQSLWYQKGAALEQERIVAHMIEPNFEVGDTKFGKVPGNFTWRETYWIWGSANEKPLSLCGFNDQPFTCARWSTQSNDAYGRSPGMDVLPDIMQLQTMTRRMAEAIEKQVRPPLIADEKLRNQPSSILPGHVTYVPGLSAGTGMRSIYEVNPDIRAMSENILAIENRIKVGLFNDLFLMLEQGPTSKMTAYEVAQKMQEKLQVLGPVIEGLLTESLKPKLKRIFAIMKKRGMIDPPPPSMQGIPLDIQFVSMLALAQKAAATGGIERLIALIGNMSAVFPEVKDNVNPDEVINVMNDLLGNPQKILFSADQIQQKRQAAQQAQANAQKMQAMGHMADTANTGAQAAQVMSQTQIGGGTTALSALLGNGGGGAQ
jgi:hypothetical protein